MSTIVDKAKEKKIELDTEVFWRKVGQIFNLFWGSFTRIIDRQKLAQSPELLIYFTDNPSILSNKSTEYFVVNTKKSLFGAGGTRLKIFAIQIVLELYKIVLLRHFQSEYENFNIDRQIEFIVRDLDSFISLKTGTDIDIFIENYEFYISNYLNNGVEELDIQQAIKNMSILYKLNYAMFDFSVDSKQRQENLLNLANIFDHHNSFMKRAAEAHRRRIGGESSNSDES
ncbi:MAG: hypothetical protein KatS3mg086_024 [Candidatus Dojkabacteria bacterium]|nr:MAG: hypothetical protein KatS3mg086_024 [Candidatus Dojkabacteria bacterium]